MAKKKKTDRGKSGQIRTPFDQLAKQSLEAMLAPAGQVRVEQEVSAEVQKIDVWFAAEPSRSESLRRLGLLGRLAEHDALFEHYSTTPSLERFHDSLRKLHNWHKRLCKDGFVDVPPLWVLSPEHQRKARSDFALDPSERDRGVYLPPGRAYGVGLVVLSELQETPGTLLLRLLGRGETKEKAFKELLALPEDDFRRDPMLEILIGLEFEIELSDDLQPEEVEFLMSVRPTLKQYKEELLQRGETKALQRTLLHLYEARLGPIPDELRAKIEQTQEIENLDRWTVLFATASAEEIRAQLLGSN